MTSLYTTIVGWLRSGQPAEGNKTSPALDDTAADAATDAATDGAGKTEAQALAEALEGMGDTATRRWVPPPDVNARNEPKPPPYVVDENFVRTLRAAATPERLKAGREDLVRLVAFWQQGFEDLNAPQPDRVAYLTAIGPHSFPMLVYIESRGGLIRAIDELGDLVIGATDGDRRARVVRLAANMAQVGSLILPDLADAYIPIIPWEKP